MWPIVSSALWDGIECLDILVGLPWFRYPEQESNQCGSSRAAWSEGM